jgi:hypothetical protein
VGVGVGVGVVVVVGADGVGGVALGGSMALDACRKSASMSIGSATNGAATSGATAAGAVGSGSCCGCDRSDVSERTLQPTMSHRAQFAVLLFELRQLQAFLLEFTLALFAPTCISVTHRAEV